MNNQLDQKLEQYEQTAVNVANEMYNPNLRAESSKEILENFPSVRLTSEKQKVSKSGRGKLALSTLFLSTVMGACCFGAGYKTKDYINSVRTQTPQLPFVTVIHDSESFKKTIENIIAKDLGDKGLVFLEDLNSFAKEYATRLLGKTPDEQQLLEIKRCLESKVRTVQAYVIDGSRTQNTDKVRIYRPLRR